MMTRHNLALWVVVTIGTVGRAAAPAGGGLKFTKKLLMLDLNEGCAVADVNRDGRTDVIAGRNWYAAPQFLPRPLRLIEDWRKDYVQSNGDHIYDVNGDGWVDVIAGSFYPKTVFWYQNPGRDGLRKGRLWTQHLLKDTGASQNEAQFLRDLDGDRAPEWIVNSWSSKAPLLAWKLAKDDRGKPTLRKIVIGSKGNGHGMGFGDINGDGREDILVGTGWYERPATDALATEWKSHPDWNLHASCPMLVVDLDGDGRNDIIWGDAHNYGLYWMRQLAPQADGKTKWQRHLIDRSWSQPHCLHWADLDGDGQPELIAGKRVRAHAGGDPGGTDPPCLYYYTWEREAAKFTRHTIDEGSVGGGLQIRTADLNGDDRLDIVVAGKSGTYILFNQGAR